MTDRASIQAQMALTVFNAIGATVEVTPLRDSRIAVCGAEADVIAARAVFEAAGCALHESETDDDYPGQRFDYYRAA